ncbi:MAG: hypothetical protein QM767_04075 [Anaeromyxobacter sp.]
MLGPIGWGLLALALTSLWVAHASRPRRAPRLRARRTPGLQGLASHVGTLSSSRLGSGRSPQRARSRAVSLG